MTELQRSHAELRAAVMLAGKEIRKLNFGRAESPVLAILRRVLPESRAVARKEGFTTRVRLDLPVPHKSRRKDRIAKPKEKVATLAGSGLNAESLLSDLVDPIARLRSSSTRS